MKKEKLSASIEAILLAADKPVSIARIHEVLGEEAPIPSKIEECLEHLIDQFHAGPGGFEIRKARGGYQFVTKADYAGYVRRFLETRPFRLSRSALEVLAVIAYKQPITRAEVDNVRGIDSSHLVRTLIEKGVIKMAGKADVPGRPVQYGTTEKFLDLVGLKTVQDLPPLSELKELEGDIPKRDKLEELEEGLGKFIESQEIIDSRAQELADGLSEVDAIIKSAGDPKRDVFPTAVHQEVADENKAALTGFLESSKGWKKKRDKAAESAETSAQTEKESESSPIESESTQVAADGTPATTEAQEEAETVEESTAEAN